MLILEDYDLSSERESWYMISGKKKKDELLLVSEEKEILHRFSASFKSTPLYKRRQTLTDLPQMQL